MPAIRLTAATPGFAVLTIVVAGVAAVGIATVVRADAEHRIRYESAHEMARKAGCADTFTDLPAFAGVLSAGQCRLRGGVVDFRVLKDVESALAWQDGARHGRGSHRTGVVGDGWIAETSSRDAAAVVVPALTTP